jgi:hypothetical protein
MVGSYWMRLSSTRTIPRRREPHPCQMFFSRYSLSFGITLVSKDLARTKIMRNPEGAFFPGQSLGFYAIEGSFKSVWEILSRRKITSGSE